MDFVPQPDCGPLTSMHLPNLGLYAIDLIGIKHFRLKLMIIIALNCLLNIQVSAFLGFGQSSRPKFASEADKVIEQHVEVLDKKV
jgi:hypothetical protein